MFFWEIAEIYAQDVLRSFSNGLLLPVIVVLIGLGVFTVWAVVSVIIECIMQRRHFKENVPQFVEAIEAAPFEKVQDIIEGSQMLVSHKDAMLIVAEHMNAKPADLFAIAKREIGLIAERYHRVTARTDMVAKIAPMLGLMGTLIPLGPGVVAMGQGNTEVLASSLLVAFDTTIAGLAEAAICMVVSKIRKSWYKKYLEALESCMTAILEKAEAYRDYMGIPEGVEKQPMQKVGSQVVLGNLPMRRGQDQPAFGYAAGAGMAPKPAPEQDPTNPMRPVRPTTAVSHGTHGPEGAPAARQEAQSGAYSAPVATTEAGSPIVDRSKMDGSYLRKEVDIPYGPDLSGIDFMAGEAPVAASQTAEPAAMGRKATDAEPVGNVDAGRAVDSGQKAATGNLKAEERSAQAIAIEAEADVAVAAEQPATPVAATEQAATPAPEEALTSDEAPHKEEASRKAAAPTSGGNISFDALMAALGQEDGR